MSATGQTTVSGDTAAYALPETRSRVLHADA